MSIKEIMQYESGKTRENEIDTKLRTNKIRLLKVKKAIATLKAGKPVDYDKVMAI